MGFPEPYAHSFIIKVWLEEAADESGPAVWRGRITHVPSGEHRYLKDLDDVSTFIMPYLERMGVKSDLVWRVRQWLKRPEARG